MTQTQEIIACEGPDEIQECCSQKCSSGRVGWVMLGWGGSCRGEVGHSEVGGVSHVRVGLNEVFCNLHSTFYK